MRVGLLYVNALLWGLLSAACPLPLAYPCDSIGRACPAGFRCHPERDYCVPLNGDDAGPVDASHVDAGSADSAALDAVGTPDAAVDDSGTAAEAAAPDTSGQDADPVQCPPISSFQDPFDDGYQGSEWGIRSMSGCSVTEHATGVAFEVDGNQQTECAYFTNELFSLIGDEVVVAVSTLPTTYPEWEPYLAVENAAGQSVEVAFNSGEFRSFTRWQAGGPASSTSSTEYAPAIQYWAIRESAGLVQTMTWRPDFGWQVMAIIDEFPDVSCVRAAFGVRTTGASNGSLTHAVKSYNFGP